MAVDEEAPVPVLVVGAGPTGSVAALLLARLGVASTVVDREPRPYPGPRAVHLDDEAVRILAQVGLAAVFAGLSRPATGLRLLDARLRPFAEFRRDGPGVHGYPQSNLFDQPDLDAALRTALHRHPLVTLRTDCELVGIEEGRPVGAVLHGLQGTERVRAAVVLGCDGARSTVRAAVGAGLRDLRFDERWFVVDVRCRSGIPTWGGVDQVCDPRRAATFLPLPGDRYRWEFRMHPGESADALARPDQLSRLTAAWGVPVTELEVVRAAAYTFRARIADRWRSGPVLLLGDAAHLMPPFIGQGLGAGLRDAHNLAWKLAATLRGAGPGFLDTYERERAPHVEAVIRGAVRVGRALTGGPHATAALRRPLAGLLLRVPGVRGRAQRGIATRYPAGPLVDRRRHRADLPGTPCPQPTVLVERGPTPLDDVLGDGYALVTDGEPDAALAARARELGARTVRLGIDVTDDGVLREWLAAGRAAAALVRPDRIVQASSPR
ncbi:bifunctional 3-(3-hydroxy-phenyl)propionate/3-hydroxycinnamic acid hydroxylase [Pseudonocardia sp. MH-G8]|uniref:bifunctional 3-(3-hydroxy-phenyl)propionate/3-hydroxycinnamic acid hydroxylase n=1 Tax=Pseudonocardia sp. MH-G8 TaxID=1854588 RepID=UPI000BA13AC5|nr:bifunctional 3-(3-hydroxy-phenyl)propionate/3-hydroxycinnamic acid hydroxylase [Pseudonocardia sp. MH-G8]OZM76011.1 3-(3-hydroxyphenyl)propionate hydroxylase [Pseudonocardia sp. MH-G8]